MKKDVHPTYEPVVFRDSTTGDMFLTRSTRGSSRTVEYEGATYPVIDVEVSSWSHPLWTGRARSAERGGAVEKFRRRYGDRGGARGANG